MRFQPSGGPRRAGAPAARRSVAAAALLALAAGCDRAPAPAADTLAAAPVVPDSAPLLLNTELPVRYPGELFRQGVGGEVLLRLFIDSTGAAVPESTTVARSSGQPQLDSAALRGAAEMRFAPARRAGRSVAAALLVPVIFQRDTAATSAPAAPAPVSPS